MADPLSALSAWAINKITDTAIDFASNKAKSAAQDFWNENFGSVATQVILAYKSSRDMLTNVQPDVYDGELSQDRHYRCK